MAVLGYLSLPLVLLSVCQGCYDSCNTTKYPSGSRHGWETKKTAHCTDRPECAWRSQTLLQVYYLRTSAVDKFEMGAKILHHLFISFNSVLKSNPSCLCVQNTYTWCERLAANLSVRCLVALLNQSKSSMGHSMAANCQAPTSSCQMTWEMGVSETT